MRDRKRGEAEIYTKSQIVYKKEKERL